MANNRPNSQSRNAACWCGSGKRFKRCHGKNSKSAQQDPFSRFGDDVVAYYGDPSSGEALFVRRDHIWEELRDKSSKIAEEFDKVFFKDLDDISQEFAKFALILQVGLKELPDKPDSIQRKCAAVLWNAGEGILAALELVRRGYPLQPGILLRTCVEAVAVAFDLVANRESQQRLVAGRYSSDNVVTRAKRFFRVTPKLYGFLSANMSHVGEPHFRTYSRQASSEEAATGLMFVKATTALIGIATELLFNHAYAETRYWMRTPDGALQFSPNEEVLKFVRDFPQLLSADEETLPEDRTVSLPPTA